MQAGGGPSRPDHPAAVEEEDAEMKRTAALLMAALMALAACTAIGESPVTPLIVEEIPDPNAQ